jgi:hypothetical protein
MTLPMLLLLFAALGSTIVAVWAIIQERRAECTRLQQEKQEKWAARLIAYQRQHAEARPLSYEQRLEVFSGSRRRFGDRRAVAH